MGDGHPCSAGGQCSPPGGLSSAGGQGRQSSGSLCPCPRPHRQRPLPQRSAAQPDAGSPRRVAGSQVRPGPAVRAPVWEQTPLSPTPRPPPPRPWLRPFPGSRGLRGRCTVALPAGETVGAPLWPRRAQRGGHRPLCALSGGRGWRGTSVPPKLPAGAGTGLAWGRPLGNPRADRVHRLRLGVLSAAPGCATDVSGGLCLRAEVGWSRPLTPPKALQWLPVLRATSTPGPLAPSSHCLQRPPVAQPGPRLCPLPLVPPPPRCPGAQPSVLVPVTLNFGQHQHGRGSAESRPWAW